MIGNRRADVGPACRNWVLLYDALLVATRPISSRRDTQCTKKEHKKAPCTKRQTDRD
jgi:hypothetical protein